MERLEDRNCPATPIPGFLGDVGLSSYVDLSGDGIPDHAYVAQAGGSARIVVYDGSKGAPLAHDYNQDYVLLNEIVFDPSFRGGGVVTGVDHSILITPGLGGGPVVAQFEFKNGHIEATNYFAPFAPTERSGLLASHGDIDGDGIEEALFLCEATVKAYDLRSHETETSIYVGFGPNGELPEFEPSGGFIEKHGTLGIWIQWGEVINSYVAASKVFDLQGNIIP